MALNIWGDKTHAQAIAGLIEQNKINIVHVHNFFPLLTPAVFTAAKQAGAKVIHTLHNYRWWCIAGTFYRNDKGICEDCMHKNIAWPGVHHNCYRQSKAQSLVASMAFSWYHLKQYQKDIDAFFVLTQFQKQKLQSLLPPHKLFFNLIQLTNQIFKLILIAKRIIYLWVG